MKRAGSCRDSGPRIQGRNAKYQQTRPSMNGKDEKKTGVKEKLIAEVKEMLALFL